MNKIIIKSVIIAFIIFLIIISTTLAVTLLSVIAVPALWVSAIAFVIYLVITDDEKEDE